MAEPWEEEFSSVDPPGARNYYRARYYDPKVGRFISEDPIGLYGGVNFFAYVGGSPTGYTDPFGHFGGIAIGAGWALYQAGLWTAGALTAIVAGTYFAEVTGAMDEPEPVPVPVPVPPVQPPDGGTSTMAPPRPLPWPPPLPPVPKPDPKTRKCDCDDVLEYCIALCARGNAPGVGVILTPRLCVKKCMNSFGCER
jgi:RHS repeat-associated protein